MSAVFEPSEIRSPSLSSIGVFADQFTVNHGSVRRPEIDQKSLTIGIRLDIGMPVRDRAVPIASDLGVQVPFLAGPAD